MSTASTAAAGTFRRRRSEAIRERTRSWGFLAPSMVVVGLVTLYPLVYAIVLSLQHGSFTETGDWVGLSNFKDLASNTQFLHALRFSAIFTFFGALGSYLVGLGFALAVNRMSRGRWIARLGLLLPWVVPPVVSIIAWHWLLADNEALVNKALGFFGIAPIPFLASPFWASVTVIVLRIWRSFPFIFITLLAARMAVPEELYEAAELDGAGPWTTFTRVTMPQLARVSVVAILLVAIWSFNDFETIYLLTQGGPANATYNVVVLSYYQAFFGANLGMAAAMSVVGLLLLLGLAALLLRLLRRMDPA